MILCCGEALVDMLPRQSMQGEPAFVPCPGGAAFNTAIALGRLGVAVELFSGLSNDPFGQQIRQALASSNAGTRHAHISDRPTTLAFVRLVDGQASYQFHDENTAGRMLTEADLPTIDDSVKAMLFGAISLVQEPCGTAYEALMRRGHKTIVTMLDPNIRPDFIADRHEHLARMQRMMAMADIVKLSDDDLAWFGESGSHDEIAARWLERGPKLIVVTGGAKGAVAYSRQHRICVAAPKVAVVDTVGAGDTFNAGLLASLDEQDILGRQALANISASALHPALSLGVNAASVTVSRAGANPPWRHELK